MKQLILISGKAENGKDSVANILINRLEGKSTKVPLARDLKYICKDYLGWDGTKSIIGRGILQKTGTEDIRIGLGWDIFHAQRVYETIKIIENYYDYIFVCDCRFRNELLYLTSRFPNKTLSIRVDRLNFKSSLTNEQLQHESECDLDDYKAFDYFIKSECGLDNLEKEIDKQLGFLYKDKLVDLEVGDKVEVIRILDEDGASHLLNYINQTGSILSWINIKNEKRYKIIFENGETSYFRRNEIAKVYN